jgi:hypothetical protein
MAIGKWLWLNFRDRSVGERDALADSLNNQHLLEGSDVVAGKGYCANARGQVGLVFTSSSEEEAGEPFSTECPLSVALRSRSRPPRRTDCDIPIKVVTLQQRSFNLLSCGNVWQFS